MQFSAVSDRLTELCADYSFHFSGLVRLFKRRGESFSSALAASNVGSLRKKTFPLRFPFVVICIKEGKIKR